MVNKGKGALCKEHKSTRIISMVHEYIYIYISFFAYTKPCIPRDRVRVRRHHARITLVTCCMMEIMRKLCCNTLCNNVFIHNSWLLSKAVSSSSLYHQFARRARARANGNGNGLVGPLSLSLVEDKMCDMTGFLDDLCLLLIDDTW